MPAASAGILPYCDDDADAPPSRVLALALCVPSLIFATALALTFAGLTGFTRPFFLAPIAVLSARLAWALYLHRPKTWYIVLCLTTTALGVAAATPLGWIWAMLLAEHCK